MPGELLGLLFAEDLIHPRKKPENRRHRAGPLGLEVGNVRGWPINDESTSQERCTRHEPRQRLLAVFLDILLCLKISLVSILTK